MDTTGNAGVSAKSAENHVKTPGKTPPILDIPDEGTGSSSDTKSEESKGGSANFIRIYKFGTTSDYVMIALCTAGAIGAGVAMPLMFLILGRIVGNLTGYFTPGSNVTQGQFMHGIETNALIMVYLAIARFLLAYISMLTIRISGVRISARLRLAYMKAIFKQSVTSIDEISPGAVATRLTTNSNIIESGISQQYFLAIQATSFTVGLFIVAFVKDALLTLVATVAIPIVLVAYAVAVPFLNKYWYQAEAEKDLATSLAYEIFQSIRIVVAFGAEQRLSSEHGKMMERARKIDRKQAPIMGAIFAPMFLAIYGIFALTFWYGVRQYTKGKIHNVGTIIGKPVLFCVLYAVMSVYHLYSPIIQISRAASASTQIFAIIDAELPDTSGLKKDGIPVSGQDIVFRDVTFSYPSRPNTTILDKLNVRFEKGKTTAIVGPSGSGKSTIVGLIEKWYNPINESLDGSPISYVEPLSEKIGATIGTKEILSSGIYIGDVNLNIIDSKWWRSNIGLVQQEPFLFNDTIFKNVANGLAGTDYENISVERKLTMVQKACTEAFADDFISRLPLGYDTVVGEGGLKLSGGQRQRIAIARAIIKDPSILILDEATSAIDVRTEKLVQQVLDKVSQHRTTITIAHRLSTIQKADKIIVLRNGKSIEEGVHEELLQKEDGLYATLVRAQAVEIGKDEDPDPDAITVERDSEAQDALLPLEEQQLSILQDEDKPKPPKGGFLARFSLLLREQRSKWLLLAILTFSAMCGSAAYPIQSFLFAKVVDVFTMPIKDLIRRGNFLALMFCVLAFSVGTAFLILGWTAAIIAADISTFYRQEYLENILKRRISFFDDDGNSPGTLASRLSIDSTQIRQLLGGEMALQLVAIFGIIGSIIISFCFGWKLSLVGILTIMPISMLAGYYRVHLERYFEQLNAEIFAETAQFGSEAIGAFRTVTALTMEDTIISRFDDLLTSHIQKALKRARLSTVIFAFSESADMFCQPLFFWYGGRLLASREYDIIHFFVIYMGVVQSSISLGMWFSFSPNIAEATAAAGRILSVRKYGPENELARMPPGKSPAKVEFKNVYFTYKDRDVPVLQGINLKIEPGQFAAFVGASGSGKSTMISLLERFYDPSGGKILFDGVDITEVDAKSYRENLSLVAQESTLYEGTIRENISLSVEKDLATDTAITEACKAAQIHEFISSLPDGYTTHIGPKGIALSGGQRQRLALARALLRRPQLLLLDEATSNLDSESEKLVQQAIENAAGGRTIIAVAHRLSTIQNADVIFVIGSGRILEYGSHTALLSKRGMYYQMCQSQALDK